MLLSDEGKVLALTFWESDEAADAGIAGSRSFYAEQVGKFVTLLPRRRPGGRCTTSSSPTRPPSPPSEGGSAMTKLFGIPMGGLEVALVAALAAASRGWSPCSPCATASSSGSGVRNARRRPGRSALIVVGLMLGTAIITASLATGDTMSPHDPLVRRHVARADRRADRGPKGATPRHPGRRRCGDRRALLPAADVAAVRHALAGSNLVDGVAPAIVEPVGVQDVTSRQTEPAMTIFASDRARHARLRPDHPGGRRRDVACGAAAGMGVPEPRRGRLAGRLAR